MTPTIELNNSETYLLKEHNIEPYNKLRTLLMKYKSVCYETCTGSGKSYVAAQLIKNFGLKTLVVVPTNMIKIQWVDLFADNNIDADVITYTKFSMYKPEEMINSGYVFFIIDEVHHLGADVWGVNYDLLQQYNVGFLGLSADSTRWNDLCIDIGLDKFDNKLIGYKLHEAISKGIVNTFDYIVSAFSQNGEYKDDNPYVAASNINKYNKLVGKLNHLLANQKSVRDILKKHLTDENKKIIVFCEVLADIDTIKGYLSDVFYDADMITITYKQKKSYRSILRKFKTSCKRIVLFAVNVLNEGVHIDGADTIIMMRRTNSPNVFFQQIGRVTSCNSITHRVKVFDLVANLHNISFKANENTVDTIYELRSRITNLSNQIIIYDYSVDVVETLKAMEELKIQSNEWYTWEHDIIRKYYPTEGKNVVKRLPRHTLKGIRTMAFKLGVVYSGPIHPEDEIIRKYWNNRDRGRILKQLLPDMSWDNIRYRARVCGLDSKNIGKFTDDEVELAIKLYKEGKCLKDIAEEVNKLQCNIDRHFKRTANSISYKLVSMGYCKESIFSEHDTEIIRDYYEYFGTEISEILDGNYTDNQIRDKASSMGKRFIHSAKHGIDMSRLEEDFQKYGWDISKYRTHYIGSSDTVIVAGLNKLGHLRKVNSYWLQEEIDVMMKLAEDGHDYGYIASKLNTLRVNVNRNVTRTASSVRGKYERVVYSK